MAIGVDWYSEKIYRLLALQYNTFPSLFELSFISIVIIEIVYNIQSREVVGCRSYPFFINHV